ncbi:DUF6538 domain-containing protein [Vibrio campbellii]|uniref:DUF6538 domain-containing protein n=1 Tax=Vibrio campbellii TaxID=680 RepID=UPI0005F02292|nr:DUF6538 domain-containing protein [Vibrio campbellii]
MSKNKHLAQQKGETWQYRRRVPKGLEELYPARKWIIKSLGTSSVKAARLMRDRINGELAQQLQNTLQGDRARYIRYQEMLQPHIEHLQDADTGLSFEDVLPQNKVAAAAYAATIYGKESEYGVTLKEMLIDYIKRQEDRRHPDTIHKLRKSVEKFTRFLKVEDIALQHIDKKTVVRFIQALSADYSHSTISGQLSYLKTIYLHAYKLGEVENKHTPFSDHDLSQYKKDTSQRKQLFSAEHIKLILNDSPESVNHMARIALYTGARLSEVCGARMEEVEGVMCMVILKGKTEAAARIVPLPKQLEGCQFHERDHKKQGRAFSRWKNTKLTKDSSRSFHSLRAHYATAAQRAGVNEFDAANLLGHATGQTMSFGHYARADVQRLAAVGQQIADQIDHEWVV